jgi:uncharacterized heparinase superfamily protein
MVNLHPMKKLAIHWRSNSLLQWSTGVPAPEDLIAVPHCLYPGNPDEARKYYSGQFEFDGELVEVDGTSPFEIPPPSPSWAAELHGFGWLKHFQLADSPIAKSNAHILVRDWMATTGHEIAGVAWTGEVIATRLIFWLAHAPMIIENADQEFYSDFLQSIASQTRILLLTVKTSPDGMPRLLARIAIAYSSLCLFGQNEQNQQKQVSLTADTLGQELSRQFFADGGHISRNPDAVLSTMAVLLPLHQLYIQQQQEPPAQLITTLDRALPMLKFFTHADGSMAHFNGSGRLNIQLLTAVLNAAGNIGKAPDNAAHSGYQKMQAGNTALITDTGYVPDKNLSHEAHAGCLSFEMSSGSSKFIANCGSTTLHNTRLGQAARATAAHSTATLNDTSSCQFEKNYKPKQLDVALIAPPVHTGTTKINIQRSGDDQGEQITASHDGYKQSLGIIHHRTLFLSSNGKIINGSDSFTDAGNINRSGHSDHVAIRFHLHPHINAEIINNGVCVQLTSDKNERWTFTCVDARIDIEESIYFSPQAISAKQIVVSSPVLPPDEIRWVLQKFKIAGKSDRQNNTSHLSHTPQDLLDMMAINSKSNDIK